MLFVQFVLFGLANGTKMIEWFANEG